MTPNTYANNEEFTRLGVILQKLTKANRHVLLIYGEGMAAVQDMYATAAQQQATEQ